MNPQDPKKQLGSVAVDSETGVEHFDTPKQSSGAVPQAEPVSSDSPEKMSPRYGEKVTGEAQNQADVPEEFMHLFEHDPSEVMLLQAQRHPVGVVAIFSIAGAAALLIVLTYLFMVSDSSFLSTVGVNTGSVAAIGGLVCLILLIFVVGVALLAAYVYRKSRLILTNQKVVLIQYHSLIAREVSQLNIGEVEDVNVSQPRLIDRIFKTGTITIETAGEQNNYVLTQVEKPYEFAHKTIQMHEGSIAEYGN